MNQSVIWPSHRSPEFHNLKVLLLALIKPLKISRSLPKLHIYNTIKSNAQMRMSAKIVYVLYHTALLQFLL